MVSFRSVGGRTPTTHGWTEENAEPNPPEGGVSNRVARSVRSTPHCRLVADWTALTGIVVSGVVGPGVAALWARDRLRKELEGHRNLRDLVELREVLDQAASQLQEVELAHVVPLLTVLQFDPTVDPDGETINAQEVMGSLNEAARQFGATAERLGLRLGITSAVYVSHREMARQLSEIGSAVWRARLDAGQREILDSDPAREIANVQAAQAAFSAAQKDWYAAAHGLVGSRL